MTSYQTFDFIMNAEVAAAGHPVLESSGLRVVEFAPPGFARVRVIRFAAFIAALVRTHPATVKWPRERPSARQRCLYILVNRGRVEIRGMKDSVVASGGEVGIVPPGEGEISMQADSAAEFIYFSFVMNEIRPLELENDSLRVVRDSALFRASYSYLTGAVQSPEYGLVGSSRILRELTREVARALVLESSMPLPTSDPVVLVKQVIERGYRSPSFTALSIAAELGVSRRSLERACAEQGIRMAEEIHKRRASHALQLLLEQPLLSLKDVSAASGFHSSEAMRRAFRSRYQSSPTVLRATAASAASDDVPL